MERNLLYRELVGTAARDREIDHETPDYYPPSMLRDDDRSSSDASFKAFRNKVYLTQVNNSLKNGKKFIPELPDSSVEKVEGDIKMRKGAAAKMREMLQAAREEIRRQGTGYTVGISSGYRSAKTQLGLWGNNFPRYYREAVKKRKISDGDYSDGAAAALAKYISARLAAPGFSNHQDGRAGDLMSKESDKTFNPGTGGNNIQYWRDHSWFYRWLKDNASRFGFKPYEFEPWHWDFSGAVSAVADSGVMGYNIGQVLGSIPVVGNIAGSAASLALTAAGNVLDLVKAQTNASPAAHFIDRYPEWLLSALPGNVVLQMALTDGISNANEMTNLLFWLRHPDLKGQALKKESPQSLKDEWIRIQKQEVQPFLNTKPAAAPSVAAANLPANPTPNSASAAPLADSEVTGVLTALGYDIPKFGLEGALQQFQRDSGLKNSGKPDARTLARLGDLKYRLSFLTKSGVSPKRLSRFRLTHYYVVNENDYDVPSEKVPVLDQKGNVIARVPARFFNDMVMEGTGRLADGRLLNVAGKRVNVGHLGEYTRLVLPDVQKRYQKNFKYMALTLDGGQVTQAMAFGFKAPGQLGWGEQRNIPYNPFKTLAADLGYYKTSEAKYKRKNGGSGLVPAGTKVFILELAGQTLPDGTIHDGWCTVNDTGGAIYGAHFDIFTGPKSWKDRVPFPGIGHVWFKTADTGETSEIRCPPEYTYGLVKK